MAIINEDPRKYWDFDLLKNPPVYRIDDDPTSAFAGLQSIIYDGVVEKGHKTACFAYIAIPDGVMPPGGWPGIVLVHGGGGTAFAWAHPEDANFVALRVTASSFYYNCLQYMITFAGITGHSEDAVEYRRRSERVKNSFRKTFCRPDGGCSNNTITELACALYYDFTGTPDATAALLVEKCREAGHRAIFGIIGAKLVPRVLADHGFIEDAFKIITQDEFPGWGYSIKQGATTLWEQWSGINSQCHIMYGSVDGWLYEYLAGIKIEEPAFRVVHFAPCFVKGVNHVEASRKISSGAVSAKWTRDGDKIIFECHIPEGSTGILELNGIREAGLTGVQKRIIG